MPLNGIADPQTPQGPTGAAIAFVSEGWDFFEDKINTYSSAALALIEQLSYVPTVQPIEFHVEFPDITGLTSFVAPPRPTLPELTYNITDIPDAPDLQVPPAPALTQAPVFDVAAPAGIVLPVQPGTLDLQDPGDVPEMTTLVLPAVPVFDLPELPSFFAITLPEAPTPTFPTFDALDPGDVPRLPDLAGASFTEQAYTPALLAQLTPVVRNGLASGQLLDISIEQALFARSRTRVTQASRQARQAIDELFTSRGFKQPPGAWAAAHVEQLQKDQDAVNDANREQTIQHHTQAIENVKYAITQGIALEQVLIAQHGQIQDRALQACRLLLDTHLGLFNADVNRYNASITLFTAKAGVFRELIGAEIAKLEVYKAQVDGQRALADMNKAAADAYESQIRGIAQIAELYKAQIAGVQAQADIEKTRIEGYRAKVQGYAERVGLYTAQWGGYKAAVEAQQASFRSYEIGVNAYTARVNAWGEGERNQTGRYETDLKAATLRFDSYRARIQGAVARLQVEEGRINAIGTQTEAIARMYQADATIEGARSDANTRAFQAVVEAATNRANIELREAEIKIQDASRLLNAQLEAIKAAGGALSNLTASAMSAVNFNAGVNGSGSESAGWSYSWSKSKGWSWNGETEDNNSPDAF